MSPVHFCYLYFGVPEFFPVRVFTKSRQSKGGGVMIPQHIIDYSENEYMLGKVPRFGNCSFCSGEQGFEEKECWPWGKMIKCVRGFHVK